MGLGVLLVDLFVNLLRALWNLVLGRLSVPAYVVVEIRGSLPERRPLLPPFVRWLRRPPPSLEEIREQLDRIASHPRIRGIVLTFRDLNAGWASLEGLRRALVRFRSRGKRICAYLPTATLAEYYVASVSDRILAPEGAELWLVGLRWEIPFLRAALDRLGILPQVHHLGEYKTALHPLLHERMPPEQREACAAILEDVLEHVIQAISESRGLAPERAAEAIERGLLSAQEALARNLVDALAYEDDLPGAVEPGRRVRIEPWSRVRRRLPRPYRWRVLDRWTVGVVEVVGALVLGESQELPFPVPGIGRRLAGHETIARALRRAERDRRVRAVVLHVDSPGGLVVASELLAREVHRLAKRKPVVVHMGNVAASGAYYLACGARHLVAAATTLTGSIGVVGGKLVVEEFLERLGVRAEVVARPGTATLLSPYVPYTDRDWALLVGWMRRSYERFKAHVAASRGKSVEEVEAVARGRVWTGIRAKSLGLVDAIGDFEHAVQWARHLARLPRGAPVRTLLPPPLPLPPSPPVQGLPAAAALLREPVLWMVPASPGNFY